MIQSTKYKALKTIPGFTLVEALALIFVFSLIMITFYSVITLGTRYIQDARNRLGALAIANEKMEIVRNLDYDDIGTIGGGSIDGNILENEDVTENGRLFHVNTIVGYVDDDYDNNYPSDSVPGDYKKVIITVSWDNEELGHNEVQLMSRFVPPGLEVLNSGDGILSINVFSDQPGGTGIPNASVHIANSETGLNTTQQTDSSGNVILIGENIQDSIQNYEITVTKDGYETVSTMPPYPTTPYNPTYVHASVASGAINVADIVENKLSDLQVETVDYQSQPIADINFRLVGGKVIGTQVAEPYSSVFNLETESNTDSNGERDFPDISPGEYKISLPATVTDYEIIGTDPDSPYEKLTDGSVLYYFSLFSETPLTYKLKLAEKTVTSCLVSVLKNGDESPVSGASVQLSNELGYDSTQTTGVNGKVFFPTSADPFLGGVYTLEVTADGFNSSNSQVTVNNGELKVETIKLDAL